MWKVLIVDDDRNITKLLDFAFRQAGFDVQVARNGNEGLTLAMDHVPDAAILDVMMPGMHGYELCRKLRADQRTAHTKIVFLTARSQPLDEQEGRRAGGDLFLSKPVMPDDLVAQITSMLAEQGDKTPAAGPEPTAERDEAAADQAVARTSRGSGEGRLIVCLGGGEGAGVTTIAANLAVAFSLSRQAQTPLVELHAQPGDLLPALGLSAGPPYGDLQATGALLTWDALPLHLMDHSTGVRVLPAPPLGSDVSPALTHRAISILRTHFSLVVADADSGMDERISLAVASSDLVLLIVRPDATSLRAAWQLTQDLRTQGYPSRQILLVVNHTTAEAGVPLADIRQGLKYPVLSVVPYEPAMRTMFEIGKPLIAVQPRSATSLAIGRMAMQLVRGL